MGGKNQFLLLLFFIRVNRCKKGEQPPTKMYNISDKYTGKNKHHCNTNIYINDS